MKLQKIKEMRKSVNEKTKKYKATIIGVIFSIVSIALTFTYVAPFLFVSPGIFIQGVLETIVNNEVLATTVILAIFFFVALTLLLGMLEIYHYKEKWFQRYG